jgi:hypothetical protein
MTAMDMSPELIKGSGVGKMVDMARWLLPVGYSRAKDAYRPAETQQRLI